MLKLWISYYLNLFLSIEDVEENEKEYMKIIISC